MKRYFESFETLVNVLLAVFKAGMLEELAETISGQINGVTLGFVDPTFLRKAEIVPCGKVVHDLPVQGFVIRTYLANGEVTNFMGRSLDKVGGATEWWPLSVDGETYALLKIAEHQAQELKEGRKYYLVGTCWYSADQGEFPNTNSFPQYVGSDKAEALRQYEEQAKKDETWSFGFLKAYLAEFDPKTGEMVVLKGTINP